jgi:multiple sugar transport system permease protein
VTLTKSPPPVTRSAGEPASRSRRNVSNWADRNYKWLFASPALIFIVLLIGFPLLWTVYLSMTDASGSVRAPHELIGFGNYAEVLADGDRFWPAAWRTAAFTSGALLLELVLGMGIALLLRQPFRAHRFVRVVVLLPFVATPVAVAMMWRLILDPNIGFANVALGWFGISGLPWLSSPEWTLPTLIMIDVWQFTPMIAIILLAGLTALPEEPDEAARIDGASAWQRFRFVTMPMLRPVIVVAVLLRCIDALKTFDLLYATKDQGGGSFHEAETLNIYVYTATFKYNEYGLSSAVLVLFFLMILAVIGGIASRRVSRS